MKATVHSFQDGTRRLPPVLLVLTLLLTAGDIRSARSAKDDLRTWTSTAGSTVEARLVARDGDEVTLETADGRRLTLRLDQLDPASRKQAVEAAAPASGTGAVTENDGWLPTFADGPDEGSFASFRAEHFEAFVTRTGTVRIFLKDAGARTSDRFIHLRPGLGYTIRGEWQGRPILSASSDLAPQVQPDKVTIQGTAKDDVEWEFTYEFREDGVTAWGSADDPRDIERPTICQVVTTLPRYEELDYTKPEDEIRSSVGESFLAVEKDRGKDLRFNYHDRYPLGPTIHGPDTEGESEAAEVGCTFFGPRVVRWEAASLAHGRLLFHNSGNAALFEGYTIYLRNRDASANSRKSRMEITVR